MSFEWDENKNEANIVKHDVSFETAARIFDGDVLEFIDDRYDYGEVRIAAIGEVEGLVLTVVYTWRGDNSDIRRLISARRALGNEQRAYYQIYSRELAPGYPHQLEASEDDDRGRDRGSRAR